MIGGNDGNAQQVIDAVMQKMMDVYMAECGDDMDMEPPTFDEMAAFFEGL
jgi:hypothetical protein